MTLRIVLTLPQTDPLDLNAKYPLEGRGAVETIVAGWAEELTQRGHRVRIAVLGPFEREEINFSHSYELAHINHWDRLAFVAGEPADVIVANNRPHHLEKLDSSSLRVLFMHNPPAPYSDNNTSLHTAWPPVGEWDEAGTKLAKAGTFFDAMESLRSCDLLLSCSDWLAHRIAGMSGSPVERVYPHIASEFSEIERPKRRESPVLLYSGRLIWRKGLADIAALAHAGSLPGKVWITDFVNTAAAPPDTIAVRKLLQASPHVELIPPARSAHAMARLVATADVALVPSTEEPLGLVAIEALAAGTPVVGYSGGGLPETGEEGLYLVNSGDTFALNEAVAEALTTGPLTAQARHKVTEKFSAGTSTDSLLAKIEASLA